MIKRVNQLKEGEEGNVHQFSDEKIGSKLMIMGMLPNSKIKVVRVAPFKGGYYLKVDGNGLAVREEEAASVQVTTT